MTVPSNSTSTSMISPVPIKDAAGSAAALRWSALALVSIVWISAAIFGLYIVAFYFGAVFDGALDEWNQSLPRLHEPRTILATVGIGVHFAAGTILLLLGPVQLIGAIRRKMPRLHRWTGRLYVFTALTAGAGGLIFIALRGTVGGTPMTIGFSLYGMLTIVAAMATVWHARERRFDAHRAWAIRLYALVIGSWLYRMDYGFWKMLAHGAGHTRTFDGQFDVVMAFFFYIPNLIIAEAFIRARRTQTQPIAKIASALVLTGATAFVALGTYYFTAYHWGPAIVKRVL
jgi:hypothetical protein